MKWLLPIVSFCLCLNLHAATYYFANDGTGFDYPTNNGLSTNTPWQHHPYMSNVLGSFTGYTHSATNDSFVFKGGNAWPGASPNINGCFPMLLHAGGSGTNMDYYGVQSNWYSGSVFARPIFNGQHLVTDIIVVYGNAYNSPTNLIFDSLDIFGITCLGDNHGCIFLGPSANVLGKNLHIHDWLSSSSASGTDGAHGGWMGAIYNTGWGFTNIYLVNSEVDNVENGATGNWNGQCCEYFGIISNCFIHDNGSALAYGRGVYNTVISNISYPYFDYDPMFHVNGFYMDGANWTKALYDGSAIICANNLFYNCGAGANMAYAGIEHFSSVIYNTLFVANPAMSAQEAVNCDPDPGGFGNIGYTLGGLYVGNCTIWVGTNSFTLPIQIADRSGATCSVFQCYNNLLIGTNTGITNGPITAYPWITNGVAAGNLALTPIAAASYGLTVANNFVPTQAIPLAGQNNSAFYTLDLLGTNYAAGPYPYNPGAYEFTGHGIIIVPGGAINLVPGTNGVNLVP